MIRREQTESSNRMLARVAGLLAFLVAASLWFAPAATAVTPIPSGEFVTDTGSSGEAAQRIRFNDIQSALQLALRAQEAVERGAYGEAKVLYQQALPILERALGAEDLRIVGPLANLADVYRTRGEFDRAELLYRRLAFLMEQAFGAFDVLVGDALASTAEAVASQGHHGRAKPIYERALSIYQATLGADDPRTVRVLNAYADLLVKLDRRDEAEALKARLGRPSS